MLRDKQVGARSTEQHDGRGAKIARGTELFLEKPGHARSATMLVLLQFCRGTKGVAFTDALDNRPTCPALPQYGTPEYDTNPSNRLHASMPALLSAAATSPDSAATADSAPPAEAEPAVSQARQTLCCVSDHGCLIHFLT